MPQNIPGFNSTLEKVQEYGIMNEDAGKIEERL
jgi:hypothetical protein